MFNLKNFIAEIGVNHENDIDKAFQMISECSNLGIGAVKFQSYISKKIAADYSPSYWDTSKEKTTSQAKLFSKYDKFLISDYKLLAEYCNEKNIEFMSTPFDVDYVRELEPLVKRYKVASVDLTNHHLLDAICETKKPIIMSTGASSLKEIDESVNFIFNRGTKKLSLLHCVTNYPTPFDEAGLEFISILKKEYPELKIGYSDHTIPKYSQIILLNSIIHGAEIIEKHYTFDKSLPGNDHYHSFDKEDLSKFIDNLNIINVSSKYHGTANQSNAIKYARRGSYLVEDIAKGELLTKDHIIALRPQLDFIPINQVSQFYGKKLNQELKKNTGIKKEYFDDD